MPHAHTVSLLEAWSRRRTPGERLPARTDLSPLLFGPLSPQMFLLAEDADGWRFRTAGERPQDLHGRALVGDAFAELWTDADRGTVRGILAAAQTAETPRVVAARGETARGGVVALEITLAPVTGPLGAPDRCLGLCQPLTPLARLTGDRVAALHLTAPSAAAPGPRLVVDNTRVRP